jgi:hypothetical protein
MRMMYVAAALCLLGCSNAYTDPEGLNQGLGDPPITSPQNANFDAGVEAPPTAACPGTPSKDARDCADAVKACYAKGSAAEDCELLATKCKQAGVPGDSVKCQELIATCAKEGTDPETCKQRVVKCEDNSPKTGGKPGPVDPKKCAELGTMCADKGVDPKTCEQRARACEFVVNPAVPGMAADNAECTKLVVACKDQGPDAKPCEEVAYRCEAEPGTKDGGMPAPVDPEKCAELVATCADQGIDPKTCDEIAFKCEDAAPL